MLNKLAVLVLLLCAALVRAEDAGPSSAPADSTDPLLWLENIDGTAALAWVHAQNERTFQRLKSLPIYDGLYHGALAVLDSKSRIPDVHQLGAYLYNLWQDAEHPRGLYRRVSVDDFRRADPPWQTVLDIDALSQKEGKPWSFGGLTALPPEFKYALVSLSPGGGDAHQIREFDLQTLSFVPNGFSLPTAKSAVSWLDPDTLFVGTDFGTGTLTKSGYPRRVALWKRGQPLSDAHLLYECEPSSVDVQAHRIRTASGDIDLVEDHLTFWTARYFQRLDGRLLPLDIPATTVISGGYDGQLLLRLRDDWQRGSQTYPAGALLLAHPASLRGQGSPPQLLFHPSTNEVLQSVAALPQGIFVTLLDDVRGRLYRYDLGGAAVRRELIRFPDNGSLSIQSTSDETGDLYVQYESFLEPPALFHLASPAWVPQRVKEQAPTFASAQFQTRQFWATSADGTSVPYFVVGSKTMRFDGQNPVWMFSYGGFEHSLTPSYSGSYEDLRGAYGKLWLERGGTFVLANIRGGGEFGPVWHRQSLRENHVKSFEDFEAVARDLAARRITSPACLGIEGRSNGGLLVAATLLRHPELYGAVVCGNPLVDMRRYSQLLAGASWVAEYGDPNVPEDWSFLSKYSPYQNLRAGLKLPPVFFYSSTRDDRVHPGHARKMVARMESLGYDVDYFENTEGGHHGSVTHKQLATRLALSYAFLWQHLHPDPANRAHEP